MSRLLFIITSSALLAGCQQPRYKESVSTAPAPPPPKVTYNETFDDEIKAIMDFANTDRWEEAQTQAAALLAKSPDNSMLQRLYTWVGQQAQQRREQALEDKIREVEAKNSVFNPTIPSLLTEQKDRGLPASKDVRDTVNRIENSPYIPDTYGRIIREKGPLFDLDSAKGPMARVLEKEVSIHLDNVALEAIIVNLSQTAGVNIVADKSLAALKQQLSVNLDKVRLGELLKYIGRLQIS